MKLTFNEDSLQIDITMNYVITSFNEHYKHGTCYFNEQWKCR